MGTPTPTTTVPCIPECWSPCDKSCDTGISMRVCTEEDTDCTECDHCTGLCKYRKCNEFPCIDNCTVGPSIKKYFNNKVPDRMYTSEKDISLGDVIEEGEEFNVSVPCWYCVCKK